jgi:hypothetical protein
MNTPVNTRHGTNDGGHRAPEDETTQDLPGFEPGRAECLATLQLDADTLDLWSMLDAGRHTLREITAGGAARVTDTAYATEDSAPGAPGIHEAATLAIRVDVPTLELAPGDLDLTREQPGSSLQEACAREVGGQAAGRTRPHRRPGLLGLSAPALLVATGVGVLGALGLLSWASIV